MKFKIRFADQIVGVFIVLSLAALVFVIIMLGSSQRWFARDASFHTILPSAGGLARNMAVQYRGFTIGNVRSFRLTEADNVEVVFTIFEEYRDRVRLGSLVEMMLHPVGLGNQFLFHAGRGHELEEGAFIPTLGSAQARELMRQGLVEVPHYDDSITLLLNRANSLVYEINHTIVLLNEALGPGTDATEIGQMIGSVRRILADAEALPQEIGGAIEIVTADLPSILANVDAITAGLSDPDGLLYAVLDTEGEVYVNLVQSLNSISGILENLERTAAFIPGQLPQIAGLIIELRAAASTAEDVLTALTNNPLLRRGIPERIDAQAAPGPRGIRF